MIITRSYFQLTSYIGVIAHVSRQEIDFTTLTSHQQPLLSSRHEGLSQDKGTAFSYSRSGERAVPAGDRTDQSKRGCLDTNFKTHSKYVRRRSGRSHQFYNHDPLRCKMRESDGTDSALTKYVGNALIRKRV